MIPTFVASVRAATPVRADRLPAEAGICGSFRSLLTSSNEACHVSLQRIKCNQKLFFVV